MVVRARSRRRPQVTPEIAARIPPGQFPTPRWPVLHHGPVPSFDPATWDLRLFGLIEREVRLSWASFRALPMVTVSGDLHCVSRWSKLDNTWQGVPAREILDMAGVKPEAKFVLVHCDGGYTTNLPFDVVAGNDVLFAVKHDGQDLTPEHGFPVRLVVPQRYAWKSAKWVRAIELLAEDQPGFWERYGYHSNADHRKEERFADDRR